MLKFEHFRVSQHHGLKEIVSTDDTRVQRPSPEDPIEASRKSGSRSHAVSSTSSNNDEQGMKKESEKEGQASNTEDRASHVSRALSQSIPPKEQLPSLDTSQGV